MQEDKMIKKAIDHSEHIMLHHSSHFIKIRLGQLWFSCKINQEQNNFMGKELGYFKLRLRDQENLLSYG